MANTVIIDAFGGDNAPKSVLEGAAAAVEEFGINIILTGNKTEIQNCAEQNGISLQNIEIENADQIFDMHDDPKTILKEKSDSSMAVGLKLLSDGRGDAFVSAGSTGALVVGATFIVKRIKGIKRPAIATIIPTPTSKFLLIDSGANAECRAEMLLSFGVMASKYMELSMGIKNPRVGLLNNGVEDTKGDQLRLDTYDLLKNSTLNFVGNIEARDVMDNKCDVLVTDGFSGNIVLKLTEGVAITFFRMIKNVFLKNIKTKIAAVLAKSGFKSIKSLMDYSEYGGAPLMGVSKPVIKAHGSSDAKAIKNAVRQALKFASSGTIDRISVKRMKTLEERIGYTFKKKILLENAITHSSYAHESHRPEMCNERLEFLGDSVLSIVVSDYLYKTFDKFPEGKLTRIRASAVCEKTLCEFAKKINLGEYLLLSHGESGTGGRSRPSILADAFEALIAAIYLDGGIEEASKFILSFVVPSLDRHTKAAEKDFKTHLQEVIQQNPEDKLVYSLVGECGPDHDKTFTVEVHINSNLVGTGEGRSKKDAEQAAAKEALRLMGIIE